LIIALLALTACRRGQDRSAFSVPGEDGSRTVVEVLNATGRGGLARIATRVLRRAGIDVVSYGNADADAGRGDSTRILVRRGDRAAGERVRRALLVGTVLVRPDSTRLVDVSVLLGADFAARAPLELHP
jgi:LytR cell envelope-related transcriptional attenuator